tara:strand:+ start:133 stop:693 length:561 start_codon:yes stop_codon:yes gene_type:complete
MKTIAQIVCISLLSTLSAIGADDSTSSKPSTELESFAAQTGAVIIRGYTELGKVTGLGTVEVDCREFLNAQSGEQTHGMLIKVTESGRYDRNDSSFIDYDEIESLLSGIDYIAKIDASVTKLKNFEATYTTRGNFAVTVFNDSKGKLGIAVSSGRIGRATAYLNFEQLTQVRTLIVSAKDRIEEIQ